jgi:predicted house-cleaning noncanonical NTP pyrophosphatase (MazG superfamily)
MAKYIPERLIHLLKNGSNSIDTCYEFSSELHKVLSQRECRNALNHKEMEVLRDFAEKVKKANDIDYYSKDKIRDIEKELFGTRGVIGFLKSNKNLGKEQIWPF